MRQLHELTEVAWPSDARSQLSDWKHHWHRLLRVLLIRSNFSCASHCIDLPEIGSRPMNLLVIAGVHKMPMLEEKTS